MSAFKVTQSGDGWVVIDTGTHRMLGYYPSRSKAERRRRFLRMTNRKRRKR